MASNFLHVFKNRRIAITFILGFSSALPLPLVWGTLKGWMASANVDLKTIGLFSLVTLPYSLKFLWAPFLDRFSLPFLNRRTSWMAVTQILLIIFIILLGNSDPQTSAYTVALFALIVAFLSASQDIVIDAYRAELLLPEELGPGASVAVVGARVGLLISGALAFVLSKSLAWSQVYTIMAALMTIGLVTSFLAPAASAREARPKTLTDAILQPLKIFFKRDRAIEILIFIIVFKLGDVVAGEMLTPFLIKMGYPREVIGTLNKGLGMVSTIIGALFAGGIVSRIGVWKSLLIFGAIQPFSNLLFVLLAQAGQNYTLLAISIGVENFCTGMGTTAFVAFLMSLCDKRFSATQYALLSSIMALSRPFVGTSTGYLAEYLGWSGYFTLSALLALPGILLLFRFRNYQFESTTPSN